MKQYFTVRTAREDLPIDGENYLARTVFETDETIDIGIVDALGNKIMARVAREQIGFVRTK